MNIKYKLFAFFFNSFNYLMSSKLENKNVFIIFDQKNSINGNVKFIKKELDKKDKFIYSYLFKDQYSFNDIDSFTNKIIKLFRLLDFFLIRTYKLSKAKYIFLNDNFFPLAYMNIDRKTIVIQLWHASGAFKRFGASITYEENLKYLIKSSNSKIDCITVSSKNISKYYEEAFSVDSKKILSLGIPRTDYYFDKNINNEENITKIRNRFEKKYPEIKNKKIILYAPTFRENNKLNEDISKNFDENMFNNNLGNECSLLFRSHPKTKICKIKNSIDVSNYEDEKELLLIADILITDYSSIMIEYALLLKPIIFYPFDLDNYHNNERGFYIDYETIPGPIAKNTEEIINFIQEEDFDIARIKKFVNSQYDYLDDKSSERIVNYIFNDNS